MTDYKFINKSVFFIDKDEKRLLFDVSEITDDKDLIQKGVNHLKDNKWRYSKYMAMSDSELEGLIKVWHWDSSKTYPKFNNEKGFMIYNKVNPEIVSVKWNGRTKTWMYQLRNIGHVGEYISEGKLKELKEN